MKLFNRDLSRTIRRIPEAHRYAWYVVRCFLIFKKPLRFVRAYLSGTALPGGVVEFRNGSRIYLSDHKDDVITVFAIYVRGDYGPLPDGGVVVDIGANIGVFALYAACRNAHTVLAYEPNGQAYERLVQNIRANRLEHVIFPFRMAVTGQAGEKVRFPVAPSAYNAIVTDDEQLAGGAYDWVKTIDLRRIVEPVQRVDVLKLDCEGGEYDILSPAAEEPLRKVRSIRMEYHLGRAQEVIAFLQRCGFQLSLYRPDRADSGSLWFDRET